MPTHPRQTLSPTLPESAAESGAGTVRSRSGAGFLLTAIVKQLAEPSRSRTLNDFRTLPSWSTVLFTSPFTALQTKYYHAIPIFVARLQGVEPLNSTSSTANMRAAVTVSIVHELWSLGMLTKR